MANERMRRRLERLLDQIDEAEADGNWEAVCDLALDVLEIDPENSQALVGQVTPRADRCYLGAVPYEMVTGRPPFLGDYSVAIIGHHINAPSSALHGRT